MTPPEDESAAVAAARAAVVAEARSWLLTPYHDNARVKGAGVDCALLLAEVYERAGLIRRVEPAPYSPQWHLHQDKEQYMDFILDHAVEVPGPPERLPLPGDVVMWRFGRCFSHGAIVVAWPQIIHAYIRRGCTLEDAEAAQWLQFIGENVGDRGKPRPRKIFTLKIWSSGEPLLEAC